MKRFSKVLPALTVIALLTVTSPLSTFAAQSNLKNSDARYITVCSSGCDYDTLNKAFRTITHNQKVVITVKSTLKGRNAVARLVGFDNVNVKIKCDANVVLTSLGIDNIIKFDNDQSLLTVENCDMRQASPYAIEVSGAQTWAYINKTKFSGNGAGIAHTGSYSYGNIQINQSSFKNNSHAAVTSGDQALSNVLIHNSTIGESDYAVALYGKKGYAEISHTTMNGLWNVIRTGHNLEANENFLSNNIISNLGSYVIVSDGGACLTNMYTNLIHNTSGIRYNCAGADGTIVSGNPQYIDSDLRVALSSPAIGAATTTMLTYDKDGYCRNTAGNQADLGAYEMDSDCR